MDRTKAEIYQRLQMTSHQWLRVKQAGYIVTLISSGISLYWSLMQKTEPPRGTIQGAALFILLGFIIAQVGDWRWVVARNRELEAHITRELDDIFNRLGDWHD